MHTDKFDMVNKVLGWGDPNGGLWFVGLEEASPFTEDDLTRYESADPFIPVTQADRDKWDQRGKGIRDYTSKIAQPLSLQGRGIEWKDYQKIMWSAGSQICQVNLFPLPKPTFLKNWPNSYKEQYGYGPSDRADYIRDVRSTRFGRIREWWKRCRPQATICFGTQGWEFDKEILDLRSTPEMKFDGETHVYVSERVILAPFFAYWHMSNRKAEAMSGVLKSWDVKIT